MNINIGMIGTGLIGLVHLLSLKIIIDENLISEPDVHINIKTVMDIDEDKLNNLKRINPYDIERFTTNPEELMKDKEIDVIYITTPTKFHKDYFIRAAEEGKNIFCEKPLAFSLENIKKMISYEKKYGNLTQVGLPLRHSPVFWKINQIMMEKKEELGKRLSFSFRAIQEWPVESRTHRSDWRKNPDLAHAGCLYEHSIHDVDLIDYLFGNEFSISKLYAKIRFVSSITQNKIEDVANVNLGYRDGLIGCLISIWNKAKIDERTIEIYFENGSIFLNRYTGFSFNQFEYIIKNKKTRLKREEVYEEFLKSRNYPQIDPITGPFLFENLSFLKSMIKGESPYPGLEIGYRAHEIIERAYQSSRENKIINFD
ncbi:MAG: Gfo/Idh/MocA family protein [Promethearchaeota archaeon]